MHTSFDPFGMIKISEQIDMVSVLADNCRNMNRIMREIVQITEYVDDMESQNNEYMVQLNNVEDLVFSRTSMNDIDISAVEWNVIDSFDDRVIPLDNQVVKVMDVSESLNLQLVRQKASLVVKRVNDMCNHSVSSTEDVIELTSPSLVIVPKNDELEIDEIDYDIYGDVSLDNDTTTLLEPTVDQFDIKLSIDEDLDKTIDFGSSFKIGNSSDIFETVVPFETTPLFADRTDDSLQTEYFISEDGLKNIGLDIDDEQEDDFAVKDTDSLDSDMPDAFWVTQEEEKKEDDNDELSFDEQVMALLNDEVLDNRPEKSDVKVRKLEVSRKEFGKNAA